MSRGLTFFAFIFILLMPLSLLIQLLLLLVVLFLIGSTYYTLTFTSVNYNFIFISIAMSIIHFVFRYLFSIFIFIVFFIICQLLLLLLLLQLLLFVVHSATFFCRHLYINRILPTITIISTLQHLCMMSKSLPFHLYWCMSVTLSQVRWANTHIGCTKPTHRTQTFYYFTGSTIITFT